MANECVVRADKNLLTEVEAASYLTMSPDFLRLARQRIRANGTSSGPPYIKIGRSVRYMRTDLDAWLRENKKI